MLKYFVPGSGSYAGVTYNLPFCKEQQQPVLNFQDGSMSLVKGRGSFLYSGSSAPYPTSADISCLFAITPSWLLQFSYTPDIGGLETALLDFSDFIYAGGLGTLKDVPPAGTKHNVDGTPRADITLKAATAVITGAPQVTRQNGGTAADIQVTFRIPGAEWTLSPCGHQVLVQ